MKKKCFWYYFLVPLLLVLIGSCRPGENLFGKCKRQLPYLQLEVIIRDRDGKNYFETHPNITWENFMIYDENWDYAKWNEFSYENFANSDAYILFEGFYIDFDYPREPYRVDRVKTFYFKYDTDIDTLRIEYKPRNECRHLDYLRIFYNDEFIDPKRYEGLNNKVYNRVITKK
jgi:hypothetical protein